MCQPERETGNAVEILIGLPPGSRRDAARLFYEAFEDQLRSFLPTVELAEELLHDDLDAERVILAFSAGRMVGFAGMSYADRSYCSFTMQDFVVRYGWIAGPFRYILYAGAARPRPRSEIVVDGLGVTASMRGRGIGRMLLDALCDYARANGFRAVRLDVADNNAPARHLYDRCGFTEVRRRRLPRFLVQVAGYAEDIEMIRML